jgi:hypothetical protein
MHALQHTLMLLQHQDGAAAATSAPACEHELDMGLKGF